MRSLVDDKLRFEVAHFDLRYTCENCAYYDCARSRCGNGYPSEPHRGRPLEPLSEISFCKEFELG